MDKSNSPRKQKRAQTQLPKNLQLQSPIKNINSNILQQEEVNKTLDKRWAELKIDGINIPARSYHSMALQNGSIIVYGGFNDQQGLLEDFNYMKISDTDNYQWKTIKLNKNNKITPGPRRRHTTVIFQDKLYLFGGQYNTIYNTNKFFCFDFKTNCWSEIETQNTPPPLDSHNCVIFNSKMIVLFGFQGGELSDYSNSIYEIDLENPERWNILFLSDKVSNNVPQPRANFSSCLFEQSIYIYGGSTFDKKFNDLWKFDLNNNSWQKIEFKGLYQPNVISGHQMIEFNKKIYIFGGIQEITQEKNDIIQFDIEKQEFKVIYYEKPIEFQSPTKKQDEKLILKNNSGGQSPIKRRQTQKSNSPQKLNNILKQNESPQQNKQDIQIDPFSYQTEEAKSQTYLQQKKQQKLTQQKYKMLRELESSPLQKNKNNIQPQSPTSIQMAKTIELIGDQSKFQETNNINTNKFNGYGSNSNLDDLINQTLLKPPKQFIMGKNQLIGKKPTGRDGSQICLLNGDQILIYGGDRHKMSYHDIFVFKLEGEIQTND